MYLVSLDREYIIYNYLFETCQKKSGINIQYFWGKKEITKDCHFSMLIFFMWYLSTTLTLSTYLWLFHSTHWDLLILFPMSECANPICKYAHDIDIACLHHLKELVLFFSVVLSSKLYLSKKKFKWTEAGVNQKTHLSRNSTFMWSRKWKEFKKGLYLQWYEFNVLVCCFLVHPNLLAVCFGFSQIVVILHQIKFAKFSLHYNQTAYPYAVDDFAILEEAGEMSVNVYSNWKLFYVHNHQTLTWCILTRVFDALWACLFSFRLFITQTR